jgi:hypothetical protein
MPDHAYARVIAGVEMSGLFVLSDRWPVGHAIQEILLMDACSEQADWKGRVVHLPL